MDEPDEFDLFRLPEPDDGLEPIVDAVLRMPEHEHLVENEIDLAFLFRRKEKIMGGRMILGTVYEPKVQGGLKDVFEWMIQRMLGRMPRFLVVLDEGYWQECGARNREILVFHELTHCQQKRDRHGELRFDLDGNPVYGLRGHDVEEFTSVVRRYGVWNDEIRDFIAAAQQGDA
ncbi:hypothetical protein [Bordetella phage vB_BbrM_PHB04]|uniref:Putative phage metallopeptidase domain-containing protein n=1 Tax=Bordetella phage vB_BbrM_PHB04 TaxID=2029657 RepID=A0A291L9Y4_9CAUD|nr:transposase [Bordetella phage vB_BbrM_PHB04]ATI15682.1 hypothetical protein [Bordetella phage vB_BbrM_PHB04]